MTPAECDKVMFVDHHGYLTTTIEHHDALHLQLASKDARIRELEESRKQLAGAVERLLDCDLGRVDEKPWPPPNYDHIQEVEAALARSEGEGA